ncbi:MAG: hypothetical protein QOG48_1769 [Verrucomicrobiota bacterium]|jgi:Flp pilus assembly protein TadD
MISAKHDFVVSLGICLGLLLITWAIFGQTLSHEFVNYDDDAYVYENPLVLGGVTTAGLKSAFTRSHEANWHPLTTISHMLDCQLYKTKPAGHHFTSVMLHSIAAVLLFLVLRQMTGAVWRSAFVASLFAIHPLHVESVAWVAERKDVLSGVFFMLTVAAYVHYVRRPSVLHYVAVLVLFACGLMSKAMLVTLPFVLLLLDYWPLGRFGAATDGQPRFRRLVMEKVPLFGLAIGSSVVTYLLQRHDLTFGRATVSVRVYNSLLSSITYIRQMIWPSRLAVFYPYPSGQLSILWLTLAMAGLVFVSHKTWALRNQRPYLIVGWLWYLGMLAPVIGLVQVGQQAHADRYTYLPHIGLYLIATWWFADVVTRWRYRRVITGTIAAAVIIVLGTVAWRQTLHWKNSQTLWTHTLAVTSRNDVAHVEFGVVFLENGELHDAIAHFREAIAIRPENPRAHSNLATALFRADDARDAFSEWEKSLQLHPAHVVARDNFALALLHRGRTREAMTQWQESLKYDPDDINAQNQLARILATANDPSLRNGARAVALAERAVQLSGHARPVLFQTLAAAYAETGRFATAIDTAKRGVGLANEQKNFALTNMLKSDIALFELGFPVRDPNL